MFVKKLVINAESIDNVLKIVQYVSNKFYFAKTYFYSHDESGHTFLYDIFYEKLGKNVSNLILTLLKLQDKNGQIKILSSHHYALFKDKHIEECERIEKLI